MSIRNLCRGVVKLSVLYCVLALVAEVGVALYLAYQLSAFSATPLDYRQTVVSGAAGAWQKVWGLQLCDLWLVKASVWVFQHRVHYALLLLAALALFYKYKERSLPTPAIARRHLLADYEHEDMKRAETREAVNNLKQTPAYKKWEGQKGRMYWSPPDEEEDWEAVGQQVFDD
jgi:hypothetical protein